MSRITHHDGRTIITEFICPPIPVRHKDWCASFEDADEYGPRGYGATEMEACADLEDAEEVGRDHGPYDHDPFDMPSASQRPDQDEYYRQSMIDAGRGHLLRD